MKDLGVTLFVRSKDAKNTQILTRFGAKNERYRSNPICTLQRCENHVDFESFGGKNKKSNPICTFQRCESHADLDSF